MESPLAARLNEVVTLMDHSRGQRAGFHAFCLAPIQPKDSATAPEPLPRPRNAAAHPSRGE